MSNIITKDTIIKIENVDFFRGRRAIYKNISVDIPKGKITAIMGPSGAGKTTMLHLIGGLISPKNGTVSVLDKNINKLSRKELMSLRKHMGVLFQSGALFTQMPVFDNVAFPIRRNSNLPENIIENLVKMKLEAVGLRGAAALMPTELSGGMARRVALARAIALDPDVMMYDEPFTGQDPISLGVVLKLIKSLNDSLNLTSVVVSHDIQEVMSIADFIIIVANQGILATGSPDEIKQSSSELVQQFLFGTPDGPVPFHYPAKAFVEELA